MSCEMADARVEVILRALPAEFSTDQFIAACPSSGGTDTGAKCPVVRQGNRSLCGRRLGKYSRENPGRVAKTDEGPPAWWSQRDGTAAHTTPRATVPASSASRSPVRQGHVDAVRWMATPEFAAIHRAHEVALGLGAVYFRPTNKGVVTLALDPNAPRFVGFRGSDDDESYRLRPGARVEVDELRARRGAFRTWAAGLPQAKDEERAVVRWLGDALRSKLELPGMSGPWLLLHQEWRFVTPNGNGRKADVLAVHQPTGRLGIIEAKDTASKGPEASTQLRDYACFWRRDAAALAPFFTSLLRAEGRLYGNAWASAATLSPEPAATFFAHPAESGMTVHPLAIT